jgi:hypothetical protein
MTEFMITEGSVYLVDYGADEKLEASFEGVAAFGSGTAYVFKNKAGNLVFVPLDNIVTMELLSGSCSEGKKKEPSGVYYG